MKTVRDFVASWRSGRGSRRVTAGWEAGRKRLLRRLLEAHGSKPLDQIEPSWIWDAQDAAAADGCSPATINRITAAALALIRDAEASGDLPPGTRATFLGRVHRERESGENRMIAFDLAERDAIIDTAATFCPWYHPFIAFQFFTGLRESEALGLKWDAVDLRGRRLTIRLSRRENKVEACKTARARRTIPISHAVAAILASIPRNNPDGWVFTTPTGAWILESNFCRRVWHPLIRATRPRPQTLAFRCTRHTWGSLAALSGASTADAAAYMGTSRDMFTKHYERYLGSFAGMDLEAIGGGGTLRKVQG